MPNWNDVLQEITNEQHTHTIYAQSSIDRVRKNYLEKLHQKTGRNIIAYYFINNFITNNFIRIHQFNNRCMNIFYIYNVFQVCIYIKRFNTFRVHCFTRPTY